MYHKGVSLPSRTGRFVRNFDGTEFSSQAISGENIDTAFVFSAAWTCLLADSPCYPNKSNRVINSFINRLFSDLMSTILEFSDLAHRVSFTFSRDGDIHSRNEFIEDMKHTPVFREYLHFYRTGDPSTLRFLMSFLMFGKKLPWINEDLNDIALGKWREVEGSLQKLDLKPEILGSLRNILQEIYVDWDDSLFLPKHGSGAVSEAGIRGVREKNNTFEPSVALKYLYGKYSGDFEVFPRPVNAKSVPSNELASRLKFVPKNIKTTRSICMEPVAVMWAQQGARLWLEEVFVSSPILRDRVNLSDQTKNQFAASYGSFSTSVDTIDLSSASDSVSWQLVRGIFPPKVLKHLLATRTQIVQLPSGSTYNVSKYAPMGSAVCFPVQCTIFSAVVILAGLMYRWGVEDPALLFSGDVGLTALIERTFRPPLAKGGLKEDGRLEPFYVYGDDIICDRRITSNVMDLLTQLGFSVNREKSYTGDTLFRESCGIYAFNGSDVTPLLFKARTVEKKLSVEALAAFIDLANRAYEYGYRNLRSAIVRFVLHHPIQGVSKVGGKDGPNPILFSNNRDQSLALFTDAPNNFHLRRRNAVVDEVESSSCSHICDSLVKGQVDLVVRGPIFGPYRNWPRLSLVEDRLSSVTDERPLRDISRAAIDSSKATHVLYQRDEVRSIGAGPRKTAKLTVDDENYLHAAWWRSRYADKEIQWENLAGISKADARGMRIQWRWTATGE